MSVTVRTEKRKSNCSRRICSAKAPGSIDVEQIRLDFAVESIAKRFFSPAEAAVLCGLEADDKKEAFFSCWTRKEAYVKALGKGLSLPLDVFEVTINPKQELVDLKSSDTSQKPFNWSIRSFVPWPGYIAALCTEGHDWRLERHTWRDLGN